LIGWAAPNDGTDDPNERVMQILARQRAVNFAPGTEYQYNNGAYNLLGTILKRSTGQSLRHFADENIFKPLGMTQTQYHDDLAMLVSNRASGYRRSQNGWRVVSEEQGVVGNSGMYSTVPDLLRWTQNFSDKRVGTRAMLTAMETPTKLITGQTIPSGIGLALGQYRGVATVSTSGGGPGIATEVTRYPDTGLATVVLCNMDSVVMGGNADVNPDVLINGVADIYLSDALAPPTARAVQTPARVTASTLELATKAGLYRNQSNGSVVQVTVRDDGLAAKSFYRDDVDFEMTRVGGSRFLLQGAVFEYVAGSPGRAAELHLVGQPSPVLTALPPYTPTTANLRSLLGEYTSPELEVTYSVVPQDGAVIIKPAGRHDIPLLAVERDHFVGDSVGDVRFLRDAAARVIAFTVSRDNARTVRFDRLQRP
jgi:hypothetical protein